VASKTWEAVECYTDQSSAR